MAKVKKNKVVKAPTEVKPVKVASGQVRITTLVALYSCKLKSRTAAPEETRQEEGTQAQRRERTGLHKESATWIL